MEDKRSSWYLMLQMCNVETYHTRWAVTGSRSCREWRLFSWCVQLLFTTCQYVCTGRYQWLCHETFCVDFTVCTTVYSQRGQCSCLIRTVGFLRNVKGVFAFDCFKLRKSVLVHGQVTIIFVVSLCLFVCAEFFSAIFDPISIKLGHMLYVWV